MINLFEHQDAMIKNTRLALRQHRNVLLQGPTGVGKTVIASYMLRSIQEKNRIGFFICHRRELIDQTAKTFDSFGLSYGYIAAGLPSNPYQNIQICSIDTLKNRLGSIKRLPNLCLWDEAHHVGAAGWEKVHSFFDKSYHVGLSATPERLDGKGLDKCFDYLVHGPQPSWLIENGFLAEYKLFSVPSADMSGVHTRMGDFVKSEASEAMDKPTITGDIITHWKRYAEGRLTIGFAVTVQHSKHLVEQFNMAGIPSAHLDGTTDKAERRMILRQLATGKIKVVFNVGLFGEGFDIAANSGLPVTIGCVIDAAPTQALGAWLQRCGRALRPQDEPAVILDHAGNWGRHGSPCEERQWSLEGRDSRARGGSGSTRQLDRQCHKCFMTYKPTLFSCPSCGAVPEPTRKIKEVEGELQQINPEAIRKQMRKEMAEAKTPEDLKELAVMTGKKPQWANHVAKAREEKQKLRVTLNNLIIGARSIGIYGTIQPHEVGALKPKALKENIAMIESMIHRSK